jgi:hypothetical protein
MARTHRPFSVDEFESTIKALLTRCWRGYYELRGNAQHEFQRDLPRLRMAILRYGKECSDRGWEFDLNHFEKALVALLNNALPRADKIEYLPLYLENAVRRHVDQRADALNEKAKKEMGVDHLTGRVLAKVQRVVGELVGAPRPTSATELAAELYGKLKAEKKASAMARAAKRRENAAKQAPVVASAELELFA